MSQTLKNEQFKKEYNTWANKVEKITDQKVKEELKKYLNNLLLEVKEIDRKHQELSTTNRLSFTIVDNRNNIQSLRKLITTKIKDCESAGLIPKN